ncbi:MAG TPA: protein kinase, partial [Kofleriaceae bacterium]|nr:protein kinase [Kofleriaceae bacterium]
KIQARLDHPAIVPVHELGYDADNRPYFTMKALTGTTLADVMAEPDANVTRMLRAFVDVCLAIGLAHKRGVVHRDLKPSNIMLGDYGEVYVLDWGVARVLGESEGAGGPGDISTLEGETQAGAVLGTPGYMAPEQVMGVEIGTPADVYALGSILFEILTREALHPRGTAALAMTMAQPCEAPAHRRADRAIAPELDSACVDALAGEPTERPTAKELADRIQRYLDGDRDLERRRALAEEHLAQARVAITDIHRRTEAMKLAGRALALDPESAEAATIVTTLMLEPPVEIPPALQARIDKNEDDLVRRQGTIAAFAIASYFTFLPFLFWVGVTDVPLLVAIFTTVLVLAGLAWWSARRASRHILWALVGNMILMIMFSRILSPLVIVPGLAGIVMMSMVTFPSLIDRPFLVIIGMATSILVPIGLEWAHWWHRTWHIEDGKFIAESTLLHLDGTAGNVFVVASAVAMLFVGGLFARSLAASRRDATRQLEIHAWHLSQLLPVEAPRPPSSTTLFANCGVIG